MHTFHVLRAALIVGSCGLTFNANFAQAASTTPGIDFMGAINVETPTTSFLVVVNFKDSAGQAVSTPIRITANNLDSDQTIATNLANGINGNKTDAGVMALAAEWTFAPAKNAKGVWVC